MKRIERINSYDDPRFSKTVLRQHGCFLVDDKPYEVEINGKNEAVVRGPDPDDYRELIEWFRFFTPQISIFRNEKEELIIEYDDPDIISVRISNLQPSQFYVDEEKVRVMEEIIEKADDIVIQVYPYGDRYISLDGHTRLYIAVKRGYETVKAIISEMDYSIYDFVDEAVRRKITEPADIALLGHDEYEKMWNRYCDEYFENRIWFSETDRCQAEVTEDQTQFISDKERMKKALKDDTVIGFDVIYRDEIIGFAMIRKYEEHGFFLWNYLIDRRYQNQRFGRKALEELIRYLRYEHKAETITVTCIKGNDIALKIYLEYGFIITDIVDEDDIHEINLELKMFN